MMRFEKRYWITALIIVFGVIPIALYWFNSGRYAVRPDRASQLLNEPQANAVLVDVRSAEEYKREHIEGAIHWPLQEILKVASLNEIPQPIRGKRPLLICAAGVSSIDAAKHLNAIGIANAKSVRGGIQEWVAFSACSKDCVLDRFESSQGPTQFPMRQSPFYEQLAQVVSGYVIKPLYSILALVLAIFLWKRKEPDLAALRWSMIFFFVGENFCAFNYIVFNDRSYLSEYLHSFGMLLAFSFISYAVFEGMDSSILHLSETDKKCAAIGLCRKCIKYENVPCGLKRTFFMIIPAMILLAFMPLFADWHTESYNTLIFKTPYNYSHLLVYQQFERLFCPLAAIILFLISFFVLFLKKTEPIAAAKIFFAGGLGALGFGMMRTLLIGFYSDNLVWSNVWEEGTELLFILGICFVLWIFRHGLFKNVENSA